MSPRGRELGLQGEHLAAEFLRMKGYRQLGQNLRSRFSELDLLFRDGTTIVAVEVKSRSTKFTEALESVTPQKMRRLRRALAILATRFPDRNIRFDVVTVYWEPDQIPEIIHHKQLL